MDLPILCTLVYFGIQILQYFRFLTIDSFVVLDFDVPSTFDHRVVPLVGSEAVVS